MVTVSKLQDSQLFKAAVYVMLQSYKVICSYVHLLRDDLGATSAGDAVLVTIVLLMGVVPVGMVSVLLMGVIPVGVVSVLPMGVIPVGVVSMLLMGVVPVGMISVLLMGLIPVGVVSIGVVSLGVVSSLIPWQQESSTNHTRMSCTYLASR